jgi:hypothetical protein
MEATENIVNTAKAHSAVDHLKNNRIEYLLVLILSHFLGLTGLLLDKASGVCA